MDTGERLLAQLPFFQGQRSKGHDLLPPFLQTAKIAFHKITSNIKNNLEMLTY